MDGKDESPTDTWMGWSNGRWEGETLVVDVNNFNDQTWFDRAGNFHSEALKVMERYTALGPDHSDVRSDNGGSEGLHAPLEDPHAPLSPCGANAQLLEFKCVEFVEELMYGHLRKK